MKGLATGGRRSSLGLGAGLLALVVVATLAAPWLAPYAPDAIDPAARLLPPLSRPDRLAVGGTLHLLGTDSIGRDILSRLLYGGRLSLGVGSAAVVLGALIGGAIGALGGYFGRAVDALAVWLIDLQLAFPFVLLAIFLLAALGGGTAAVIVILALSTWVNYARVVRAQVLSLRTRGFVEAARITGATPWWILRVHILPATLPPLCVIASFSMAQAILTEAGLSFLGVGLDPSVPSWGTMLNDGRDYLQDAWWIATMPGLAIGVTVFGISQLGEGLRAWLDPRRAA